MKLFETCKSRLTIPFKIKEPAAQSIILFRTINPKRGKWTMNLFKTDLFYGEIGYKLIWSKKMCRV